ncbi:tetratricopeptide repeat protein [Pelotalea chapellei]|uniref:Tetratricopeptide repeat protein n=1 Tax=Pelotalea chapellei TaxID=44671 RepID=A0ABS5U710_9BACT|nr:tetratricopeptide repeat protein [Pelotalea chapellei]
MAQLTGGCAMLGSKGEPVRDQQIVLDGAIAKLRAGNEKEARGLLEQLIAEKTSYGGTDEALFRLALLSLRDEGNKGTVKAQKLLEQLAKEYPNSLWARQSAPLAAHLVEERHLRENVRELKNLRELNYSLNRDNKELRQILERLKSLDLELEQKIRH